MPGSSTRVAAPAGSTPTAGSAPTGRPAIDERAVFVGTIPADDGVETWSSPSSLPTCVADPMPVAAHRSGLRRRRARELGFGDALVAAAMQWGREAGAELIEAETLPGDRNLKNLYERAGVTARLITVSKRL